MTTYGDGITVSGGSAVTITGNNIHTTSDSPVGKLELPGIDLWGHRIELDGKPTIECENCDMKEEVPDLIQMSSGFRQAVWKLYILGKFKNEGCNSYGEFPGVKTHVDRQATGTIEDKYIPRGHKYETVAGKEYEFAGGESWVVIKSPRYNRGAQVKTIEVIAMENEQKLKAHFGPEFVAKIVDRERKRQRNNHKHSVDHYTPSIGTTTTTKGTPPSKTTGGRKSPDTSSFSGYTYTDSSDNGSSNTSTSSTSTTTSSDDSSDDESDEDKSTREKIASHLCKQAGLK